MKARPEIIDAHVQELWRAGATRIASSTGKLVACMVGALGFTAIGGAGLTVVIGERGVLGAFTSTPGSWVCLVAVLFFGVLGIPSLTIQFLRRQTLVIEREGVRVLRGDGRQVAALAWQNVAEVSQFRHRSTSMTNCVLTPEAADLRRATSGAVARGLARADAAVVGTQVWTVPTIFKYQRELPEILRAALHGYRTGWRLPR